jgi:hypothetical protein
MNSPSHFLIGSFLYKFLKEEYGIVLEEESFLRGNVLPDYSPLAVMHPHFCGSSRYIQRGRKSWQTGAALATVGKSIQTIGDLCHYSRTSSVLHSRRFNREWSITCNNVELLYQFWSPGRRSAEPRVLRPAGGRRELSDRSSVCWTSMGSFPHSKGT